jgi:hypothetical protein
MFRLDQLIFKSRPIKLTTILVYKNTRMVSYIISTLRSKSVGEQVRLIGSVRTYIQNDNLINLLQNYDYNSKKNDVALASQLSSFSGVPGLKDQVTAWLNS